MSVDLPSVLISMVAGAVGGVVANYVGNKYTDRRREREVAAKADKHFLEIKKQLPKLIAEMKTDLAGPDGKFVREFFILPHQGVAVNSPERRFAYYTDEHDDLPGKIAILENRGYLVDVTPGNTPLYRMTEEFVELVLRHG